MTLQQLKEMAEKATPGPWRHGIHSYHDFVAQNSTDLMICDDGTPDNSRYIAAANPQTVLQLIERCEKLSDGIKAALGEFDIQGLSADDRVRIRKVEEALSLYGCEVPLK